MVKLEFRQLNAINLPVTEWITREGPNPRAILTEFAAEALRRAHATIETKHHGCWVISAKQHIEYTAKHIGKIRQYTSCEDAEEPDYRFIQSDEEAAS